MKQEHLDLKTSCNRVSIMSDLIRVEGEKNLYREASSGAIVNKDTQGYSQYLSERERRMKDRKELEDVKNELSEIKKLLIELTKN